MVLPLAAQKATLLRFLEIELWRSQCNTKSELFRSSHQSGPAPEEQTHRYATPLYQGRKSLLDRIELSYITAEEMIADGLTKPLSVVKYLGFVKQLGIGSGASPPLRPMYLGELQRVEDQEQIETQQTNHS